MRLLVSPPTPLYLNCYITIDLGLRALFSLSRINRVIIISLLLACTSRVLNPDCWVLAVWEAHRKCQHQQRTAGTEADLPIAVYQQYA